MASAGNLPLVAGSGHHAAGPAALDSVSHDARADSVALGAESSRATGLLSEVQIRPDRERVRPLSGVRHGAWNVSDATTHSISTGTQGRHSHRLVARWSPYGAR